MASAQYLVANLSNRSACQVARRPFLRGCEALAYFCSYQRAVLIELLQTVGFCPVLHSFCDFELLAQKLLHVFVGVLFAEALGVLLALGKGPAFEWLADPPESAMFLPYRLTVHLFVFLVQRRWTPLPMP